MTGQEQETRSRDDSQDSDKPCLGRLSACVKDRQRRRAGGTKGRARIALPLPTWGVEESYGEQGRGSDVHQGTGEYPRYFALAGSQLLEGEAGSVLMETRQRRTESELPPSCDEEGVYSTGVSYIVDARAAFLKRHRANFTAGSLLAI